MQKRNLSQLNAQTYENDDLEDAKQIPTAQHSKDTKNGLFHIKPIYCSTEYQSEKLQTMWKEQKMCTSEEAETSRLA